VKLPLPTHNSNHEQINDRNDRNVSKSIQPQNNRLTPTTAMPPNASATRKPTSAPSSTKNAYLLAYNALSAALWAGVLYRTLTTASAEVGAAGQKGWFSDETAVGALQKRMASGKVYDELERYTRLTQTLAGMEVVHSLTGEFYFLCISLLFNALTRLVVLPLFAPFRSTHCHEKIQC
jgi:very-long-chain (3R)-3-hydroxyacyl-CoA dehydratase